MKENQISYEVIGAAMRIHTKLGPGLFESVYERALEHELNKVGLKTKRQKKIGFNYDDVDMDVAFRMDLLVEEKVIVEIKAVEHLHDVAYAQTLTYLKLSSLKLGLLLNFNVSSMRQGIHRIVNKLEDE